jgi:alpha-ribazole phosphatase/probable phosphoglycerate mutase
MNDLLFLRHAETDMAGTFCGQSDPPVNAAGHAQIAKLLSDLRGTSIAAVYTSDLQRAATTANAIAELLRAPCIERPGLREIDFGAWEGRTWKEIEAIDAAYARRWLDVFPSLPSPRGESIAAFDARVGAEVDFLRRQYESGSIAVVTHAGVMRSVLCGFCGVDQTIAWEMTKQYICSFRCDPAGRVLEEAVRG